ncbi:hypothetical protein PQR02_08215 [Paraburkholderia sediminicola]|uniref:Uncharacterized protein n=1 Tax=Paraburkholderia rhynchosiae TaxID=487049 RepID=A0ACC7NA62_9BURK
MKRSTLAQRAPATDTISCAGYRFRLMCSGTRCGCTTFPFSLRMVEELLAARGELTYETVRRRAVKFGLGMARPIRSTAQARGAQWHLDEVVVTTNGRKH